MKRQTLRISAVSGRSFSAWLAALLVVMAMATGTGASAQTAKDILDKASAAFRTAGGVQAGFTFESDGVTCKGAISISGKKFRAVVEGNVTWFDGTTMWSYVKANDEVNVTTPTAAQMARMNPYTFLSLYQKGYKLALCAANSQYYEVTLTATDSGNAIRSATIRLKKGSYQPLYIRMSTGRVTNVITINSYETGKKFSPATFVFNKKQYPHAEVIDLR